MRSLHRRGLLFVLVAAMLPATAGNASAAGWLTPDGVPLAVSDLGFDAQGNAVAVGVGADPAGDPMVRAATRALGGRWSDSVPVSHDGDSDVWEPRVAVDPGGDAVAIWSAVDETASRRIVRVASRPAGGAWSEPVAMSDAAVAFGDHGVAIDAQGNATAIWTEFGGSSFVVRTASRPAGGAWSAATDLSADADGNATAPRLAVDPQGDATVVWIGDGDDPDGPGTIRVVRSRSRPAGGAWDTAVDLSHDGNAYVPQVAIDPQGGATAIWQVLDGGDHVQTARRPAGSGWGAEVDLADGQDPQVAVDPQGNATAIWTGSSPDGSVVRSSGRTAAGPWSDPVDLAADSDVDSVGYPWVAVDPQGDATAIWARTNSSTVIAQASRHVAGSGWGAEVDLSVGRAINALPAAGVDPQGYATLVWSTSTSPLSGSSSVLDPVAPELRDLAVPARGVVGQPVAMSVDPFDVWSAATVTWDFGDGGSASDAAVAHTYDSPGERTVTITAVDPAGNTTQTSRSIAIDPAPGPADSAPGPGSSPAPSPAPGPAPRPGPVLRPAPKAPVVSGLRQSSARWRTQSVRRRPRLPVGTTFRFTLDRAAQVRFAISEIVSGRRVGARCVGVTKANRKKASCDRFLARGTLSTAGKAGANAFAFRGRIHGHALKPGRYRVLVSAVAGGTTSRTASVRFTIVR